MFQINNFSKHLITYVLNHLVLHQFKVQQIIVGLGLLHKFLYLLENNVIYTIHIMHLILFQYYLNYTLVLLLIVYIVHHIMHYKQQHYYYNLYYIDLVQQFMFLIHKVLVVMVHTVHHVNVYNYLLLMVI